MNPILLWYYHEAPQEHQARCAQGGDEDWIALVPKEFIDKHGSIPWHMTCEPFAICAYKEIKLENGDVLVVAVHA